jgi:hypothetical protein
MSDSKIRVRRLAPYPLGQEGAVKVPSPGLEPGISSFLPSGSLVIGRENKSIESQKLLLESLCALMIVVRRDNKFLAL